MIVGATDGPGSATTTVEVLEADGGGAEGGDTDGADPSCGDADGGDPTGGDPVGGGLEGGDPDGDPSGGDIDGGDPTGGSPEGGDPVGGNPEGADPDGDDPTGADADSGDVDGDGPDGTDPSGDDSEGTDPDGTDLDGADPDGEPGTVDAVVVADPATVREGDELTVEGTGFPPSSEITITYVDADGATVATHRVGTDEEGGFTDVLVVPAGTALGELVVTATASGVSATTSVEVAESGEGDPDGGDPTGDDAEGADTAGGGDTDGGDGGDADGGDAAGDGTDGADDDGDSEGADADGQPGDVEVALLADPATVRVGEAVTVTGTDFPPTAEVTVTYVDASGDTVATHVVTSDETGAFSDVLVVPAGTALGELVVTATAGGTSATAAVEVVEAAGGDDDDVDGGETDADAADGDDPTGGDVDGVDPTGGDPDGGDPAGGGSDGGDPAGDDSDGDDPMAGDPDGGDPTGGDTDGGDAADGVSDDGDVEGADGRGEDTDGEDTDGEPADLEPVVAADPAVVGVGDELSVTGTGFPPSSEVTVTYVDADGVTVATQLTITSDTGELTDVLAVPTGTALGELVVTATAGATSATTSVEVVETDDGDVEGGDTGGGGADAGDTDAGDSDAGDPTGGDPTGGDSDGEDPGGADSDGAADSDGSDTDGEPGDLEPAVVADPGVVGVGDALTVTGTGFPPSSEVTVGYVDDEGTTVATHRVTTDETGAFTDVTGDPDGGDADGGDTGPDGGDTSGGDTDGSEGPGDADPSLEVDPGTVRPGEQLTTSGSGFPPSTEVTVTYVDSSGRTIATSTVTTDETGAFTDTIAVPAGTPAGTLTIIATAGERTAPATARVIRLGIGLDHPARQRGEVQVGRGTGYAPGTVVHAFMSSAPVVDLGTRVADADGEVTFTWTVPASAGLGTHMFSLTAEGYADQAATFEVVGAPAAPGSPTAPAAPTDTPLPIGPGDLAGTGFDATLAGAAGLLLLAGALVLLMARAHRGSSRS